MAVFHRMHPMNNEQHNEQWEPGSGHQSGKWTTLRQPEGSAIWLLLMSHLPWHKGFQTRVANFVDTIMSKGYIHSLLHLVGGGRADWLKTLLTLEVKTIVADISEK